MRSLIKITLLSLVFSGCNIKAEEFFEEYKREFENSWWDYYYGDDEYCFNAYEDHNLWLYDIQEEDAWPSTTWSFTPPNTYHVDGYDIDVIEDDECYKLTISGVLSRVACECPVDPDWTEPR